MRLRGKVTRVALVLAAMVSVLGCSRVGGRSSVSGKVSYRGSPLTNGSIMFYPEHGQPMAVSINPDSRYVAELPPGEYRVTVSVGLGIPAGWKEGDPPPPQPKIVLPPEYSQRAKTVLNLTVAKDGEPQTADFVMK